MPAISPTGAGALPGDEAYAPPAKDTSSPQQQLLKSFRAAAATAMGSTGAGNGMGNSAKALEEAISGKSTAVLYSQRVVAGAV